MLRRRFKQAKSLKQRLLDRVRSLRDEARLLPPGAHREGDTAAHMDEWLRSPGLEPPK